MDNLHNYFGLNIMPWRPPLDVLDEKIRPALKGLIDRMGGTLFEFRIYRGVDGTVYAEMYHAAKPKKVNMNPPRLRSVVRFVDNWGTLLISSDSFDALFKPRQVAPFEVNDAVYNSARKWWLNKRPVGWNLRQHLKTPAINCTTANEATLAYAVARVEFIDYYKRVGNVFSC